MDNIPLNTEKTLSDKSIFDWIFILRPVLHPPVWTIVIFGYYLTPTKNPPSGNLFFLLIVSSALAGYAYLINQIFDIESDRLNNKNPFLSMGLISVKSAIIYSIFLAIFSIVASFTINSAVGWASVVLVFMGYAYSGWPFYSKNHPIAATLGNGLGHGSMGIMFGYAASNGSLDNSFLLSTPYLFAVIAVYVGTTLPDIKGDTISGKRTPGVVLGVKPSISFMVISVMIALVLSIILADLPMITVCGICLPFYIFAFLQPEVKYAVLAARISVLLLSLAACVLFPWYILILAFLFVTTRVYYRNRFGIKYPSLSL